VNKRVILQPPYNIYTDWKLWCNIAN
jgi:hypothetical protein